jgi:GH24 family phage-related lysozyme (muramidase)
MTPGNYKIIGSGRKISDLEAKTKKIAFTADKERVDSSSPQMGDLVKSIALIQAAEKTGADVRPLLAKTGVHITRNGPNKVYTSDDGFIVDTGGGVGAVANNLMTASDMIKTSNVVGQYVGKTQLSDNQMASLVLMADHIGVDKFANSRTLQLVKAHEYSKVPNSMLDFNKGTVGYSRRPKTRQDYIERGQMYGELFQTPDSIELPVFQDGSSWGAMAKAIKFNRLGQV